MEISRGRGEPTVLGVVSGLLLISEGIFLLGAVGSLPFESVPLALAGAISAFAGLGVVSISVSYRTRPRFRSGLGTLAVLFAAGGIWLGGGFIVGSVLGILSGLLMIVLPLYSQVEC